MAKKPKANSQNNTIRGIIIAFSAIIVVIGALLIWNNRSVSFAGRIDGERVPIGQLNFFHQNWIDEVHFNWGLPITDDIAEMTRGWAWAELVDMWVVSNQADLLGISLTAEDMVDVDELVDAFNAFYGRDTLRTLGFTDSSLRRFAERSVLETRVRLHVIEDVIINENELEEAFEVHLIENMHELQTILVYYIEVATQELADQLLTEMFMGASIVDLMRTHSIVYDPSVLPVDEDGELIERINAMHTNLNEEQIAMVFALGVGTLSDIQWLDNGNFAVFQVADVVEEDREVSLERFREQFILTAQHELFENNMLIWRAHADVVPNRRVLGSE